MASRNQRVKRRAYEKRVAKRVEVNLVRPRKTLMMVEQPDQTALLTPSACQPCQQDLSQARACRRERAQQFDLPSIALQATEYQVAVKACPCGPRRDAS